MTLGGVEPFTSVDFDIRDSSLGGMMYCPTFFRFLGTGGISSPRDENDDRAEGARGPWKKLVDAGSDAGDDEPVVSSLHRLRAEIEAFLTKYSGQWGADRRKRERFLYNNYSLILTIISDTTGKLAIAEQEHFEELKAAYQEAN